MKIQTRLTSSIISICIIPLLIVGFVSYYQSKAILSQKLTTTSTQTLSEVSNGIDNYLNGFSSMVSMAANSQSIVNSDENNVAAMKDTFKAIQQSNSDILSVNYGFPSGKLITYPDIEIPDGFNVTTRPWYKMAMAYKGKSIISDPFKDIGTGKMVISVSQTVEKGGQVIGVVCVDIQLSTLSDKISDKQLGNSGYVFISDKSGNILAHPDQSMINTIVSDKVPSLWDQITSRDEGFIKYMVDGKSKFGVLHTDELTGWKIMASLDESELTKDTKSILNVSFIIIILMAIIGVFVSIILSKGIAKNIKNLKDVFKKASDGDLTVSVKARTKDEFGDLANSFNKMMGDISGLMKEVKESSSSVQETATSLANMSEQVTASINEVSRAIEEVSSGATEQAQNAQGGAEEMDGLSNKIEKINQDSGKMYKISNRTKELGSQGLLMIDELIDKSNKTRVSTSEVNSIVNDMNESTIKINSISETIADITAQTNLLSLNASIESARAGEAGKGFAVVAEEIRKLAEQSRISTEEIKEIISSIQLKSERAVVAIKDTEIVVHEQEEAVSQTKDIFSKILKSIEALITKVDQVKVSIDEVNEKKQSTVMKIESISAISEETASASEEVTASTEEINATMTELEQFSHELQKLAEQLGIEISKFRI